MGPAGKTVPQGPERDRSWTGGTRPPELQPSRTRVAAHDVTPARGGTRRTTRSAAAPGTLRPDHEEHFNVLCFPAQSRVNQPCHRQRAESLLTASWRRTGNTARELIRPPPKQKGADPGSLRSRALVQHSPTLAAGQGPSRAPWSRLGRRPAPAARVSSLLRPAGRAEGGTTTTGNGPGTGPPETSHRCCC